MRSTERKGVVQQEGEKTQSGEKERTVAMILISVTLKYLCI